MSYEVKNYMEVIVSNLLNDILEENQNICHCERCIADIKAIALNSLPTRYVVSGIGEAYSKANAFSIQFKVDVINSILTAVNIVSKSPKH